MLETSTPPATYEALIVGYFDFVRAECRRAGVIADEDAAQHVLLKFYERDMLARFDPGLAFTYQGRRVPTSFKAYLAGITRTYCLWLREKEGIQRGREAYVIDAPIPGTTVNFQATDADAQRELDDVESLAVYNGLKERIRRHLLALPVPDFQAAGRDRDQHGRNGRGHLRPVVRPRPSLLWLFNACCEQVEEDGFDIAGLARRAGLRVKDIKELLAELQEEIRWECSQAS